MVGQNAPVSVPTSSWLIDPGLAEEFAAAIGWSADDGIPELIARLGRAVPAGNTAKLRSMARGDIPPGADPAAVAREYLDHVSAGNALPAWSCWVYASLMTALAETTGVARTRLAATRRTNAEPGEVDFHSTVLADDGDTTWLCDPFFVTTLPGPGADETESTRDGVWAKRDDGSDGRWSYELRNGRWPDSLEFRLFAPSLDPADVLTMCALSVKYSGVPNRPGARLWGETIVDVNENEDGVIVFREWTWDRPDDVWEGHLDRREFATWEEGTFEFEKRTGVPIV